MDLLPDLSKLNHTEKNQLIVVLFRELQELRASFAKQSERIKELEAKLSKDSHNSNKPPSSDGLKKPNPKSLRKNNGRKTGGQEGHPGSTLEQAAHPDFIEEHSVHSCENCQSNLDGVPASSLECRQEFEIPSMKMQVTEHRAEVKICPACGFTNKGKFPKRIRQPVQYGSLAKGLAVYYNQYHLIPYQRLQAIFRDVHSVSLSEGTLFNTNVTCYKKLEAFDAIVKQKLIASDQAHFDESGMRVNKKLHWLHVASTKQLTHFAMHEKRGTEAMDAIGILPQFKGRAIHDHWYAYFHYICGHGLCNAHHLREFIYHEEQYEQTWCKQMRECLLAIKSEVDRLKEAGEKVMDIERIDYHEQEYDRILNDGLKEIPALPVLLTVSKKRGRKKQHPAKNLWGRLENFKQETLAFMNDFTVPFTNNLGEQDIRMNKVKQKISGNFRSEFGAQIFCRTRGYISTAKKNGINVLTALTGVFNGEIVKPFSNTIANNTS